MAADLQARGPLVAAVVAPVLSAQEAMRAAGQPVAAPVTVTGLIDTGSARTAIDRGIASRLGLQPVGFRLISTPSSEGAVRVPAYAVQVGLAGRGGGVAFDTVTVVEGQIADQNIGILIGRDILASAVFVYVGTSGQCTISF